MKDFTKLPSNEIVQKTMEALKANGMEAYLVANADEAREKALSLIPGGSEAMTMSSITLDQTGISKAINESGKYDAAKPKLYSMDQKTQGREMRKYGAAPDVALGSAHAVTVSGTLVIASLTGSQLPAITYGSASVILVVGTQKIVADVEEGMKRINQHILPLESDRARKAYGLPESFQTFPSKILLLNKEIQAGRIKVILVNEVLGF